jgi:hypothetical protein
MSETTNQLDTFYPTNLSEYIIPKNSLLVDVKTEKAISLVVTELKKFPNWESYRADLEFLRIACTFIENMIVKNDGLDKLNILVQIFIRLFNINEAEITFLKTSVEFLLNNKRIKKIKFIKKAYNFFKSIINSFL